MLRSSILLAFIALALQPLAQTLPSRRYTTRDGLVADRITAITQDHQGFMWMGSLFGLCRYDGNSFTTITLPPGQQNKYVTSLLAADGKLYAGFLFNGCLMEYDNGRVTAHYIEPHKPSAKNEVTALYDCSDGILVVNTLNEIHLFRNSSFLQITGAENRTISSIVEDDNSRFWIGTAAGLCIFEKGVMTVNVMDGNIRYMQKTNDGMLMAITESNATTFYLVNDHYQKKPVWQVNNTLQIPFYTNTPGTVWGIDHRLGLFNLLNGRTESYVSAISASTEVKYLFADRENNLWIATDPGILKISNVPAISYEFNELAPGGGDVALGHDSTIWCTNSRHLYRIKNNRMVRMEDFSKSGEGGLLGNIATDASGHLWVTGWDGGLWRLRYNGDKLASGKYFKTYRGHVISPNSFVSDDAGNTWMAGSSGIYHIRNGEITSHFAVPRGNGAYTFLTSIAVDTLRRELWAGDNATGVIRLSYTPQADTFAYKVLGYVDEKTGLSEPNVRSLLFDSNNNLWIGTRLGGIFKLQVQHGKYVLRQYNAANGISCTRVTDIAQDKNGAVWFATCDGIYKYASPSDAMEKYSVSEGLLGSEVFSLSIEKHQLHLWAVSAEGVTNMRMGEGKQARPAPQINITQVLVLGEEDTTALMSGRRRLSADENSIGFAFAGTSYTDEKRIRYKYMLEGYDNDWSVPVQTNNVNYASLPFGQYTFKVLASNGERWSETPATFTFRVIRPFYRSFWFIALVALLLAATFYFIRVYRLQQKLKLEKLRVNIARDLHDDIGSALGSINLLSENATRRLATTQSVEEVSGIFKKIGHSAQSMLDSMDDIIWTINPEKDSVEDLLIRMREFAIPLLEARDISFNMDLDASEGVKPSMEIKRNIYLVFKEAIHNIVRHSAATHADIKAAFTQRTFDLTIIDNGKGFNPDAPVTRNGLKNMKKRAALSKARLTINSAPNAGTAIHLSGTLNPDT